MSHNPKPQEADRVRSKVKKLAKEVLHSGTETPDSHQHEHANKQHVRTEHTHKDSHTQSHKHGHKHSHKHSHSPHSLHK